MIKAAKPTMPRTRGTRTETEVHENFIPPHVRPITTEVVDPVMRTFPLQIAYVKFYPELQHCRTLHEVNLAELITESCGWCLETEEEQDKNRTQ